jgi:hypothetical protein
VFSRQKLTDGATPIVVIDTEDILLSLQKATLKNKEREGNARLPRQQTLPRLPQSSSCSNVHQQTQLKLTNGGGATEEK